MSSFQKNVVYLKLISISINQMSEKGVILGLNSMDFNNRIRCVFIFKRTIFYNN